MDSLPFYYMRNYFTFLYGTKIAFGQPFIYLKNSFQIAYLFTMYHKDSIGLVCIFTL